MISVSLAPTPTPRRVNNTERERERESDRNMGLTHSRYSQLYQAEGLHRRPVMEGPVYRPLLAVHGPENRRILCEMDERSSELRIRLPQVRDAHSPNQWPFPPSRLDLSLTRNPLPGLLSSPRPVTWPGRSSSPLATSSLASSMSPINSSERITGCSWTARPTTISARASTARKPRKRTKTTSPTRMRCTTSTSRGSSRSPRTPEASQSPSCPG